MNSAEISSDLNLAYDTVKTHRKTILFKMGAKNIVDAVAVAIRNDWIE